MKVKLKAMVAAAAMVVAGHASAALSDTFVTNGTLFLTVWDTTTFKSYTRDLGVSLDSFLPGGTLTAEAGASLGAGDFNFGSPSSLFSTTFTGANTANLRWTIIAVDNIEGEGAGNGSRLVSVFNTAPTTLTNGVVRGMGVTAADFAGALINNSGTDFSGAPAEFAFSGTGGNTLSYGGAGPGWGENMGGSSPNQAYGIGFGTAQFWYAQTTNDTSSNDSAAVTGTRFGNSQNFATFKLNTDGSIAYTLAAAVTAVPLPAAAWLMGAGLLGLGGAARRRKAAQEA